LSFFLVRNRSWPSSFFVSVCCRVNHTKPAPHPMGLNCSISQAILCCSHLPNFIGRFVPLRPPFPAFLFFPPFSFFFFLLFMLGCLFFLFFVCSFLIFLMFFPPVGTFFPLSCTSYITRVFLCVCLIMICTAPLLLSSKFPHV